MFCSVQIYGESLKLHHVLCLKYMPLSSWINITFQCGWCNTWQLICLPEVLFCRAFLQLWKRIEVVERFLCWMNFDKLILPNHLLCSVTLENQLNALKKKAQEPPAREPEPEPTTEVLFLCSFEGCGKTFIDAGALRKHSHIHGERQYVCHYEGCGKVLSLNFLGFVFFLEDIMFVWWNLKPLSVCIYTFQFEKRNSDEISTSWGIWNI